MELFFVAAHEVSDAFGLPLKLGYLFIVAFFGYLFVSSRRSRLSLTMTGTRLLIIWVYLGLFASLIANDVWTLRKVCLLTVSIVIVSLFQVWRKKELVSRLAGIIFILLVLAITLNIHEVINYAFGSLASFSDLPRASPFDAFFDLRIWTFNLSDCSVSISALDGNNHCASKYYVFDYPRYILYPLRFLGFTSEIHSSLGIFLGALTYVLSAHVFYNIVSANDALRAPRLLVAGLVSLVLMLCLPLRYAVERGQIDLIIYNTLCCYYVLSSRGWNFWKVNGQIPRYLTLALTALVKIYSLVSLLYVVAVDVACLLLAKKFHKTLSSRYFLWTFVGVFMAAICSILLFQDIYIAKEANSFFIGGHGFGFDTLLDAAYATKFLFSWKSKLLIILATAWIGFNCGKKIIYSNSYTLNEFDLRTTTNRLSLSYLQSKACAELFLMVAPFIIVLYLFTESINYKLIMLALLLPLWISIFFQEELKASILSLFSILQLSVVMCRFVLVSLPFDPSQYLYIEWLIHFFCDPIIMGGACSMVILLTLNTFRRVLVS